VTQGADPEDTQAGALEPAAASAGSDSGGRLSKKRRASIYVLIVVASLLVLISVFATWVKVVLLDTPTWVDTTSEFLTDDTIRPALATYIVNQIFSSVDVQAEVQNALPDNLDRLAAPATAGLRQLSFRAANQVLESSRVQQLWADASGAAQQAFVRVAEGKSEVVTQNGAEVTINLRPIVAQVVQQIGLSGNLLAKLSPDAGQVTILTQGRLDAVTKLVKALRIVAFWFGIAGLALWALAVYLARGRRRETIRAIAVSFLIVGLILIVFRNQVGNALVNALVSADAVKPASLAAWRIATQALHDSTITIVVVGIVGMIATWLAGPGRHATGLRHWVAPWMRRPVLVYGVYAVALLLLLIWGPTRSTRNLVTIIVLFGLATIGLEILRRQTIREFPDAEHGESALWAKVTGLGSAAVGRVRHHDDDSAAGPPADPGTGPGSSA
jgi:hypothetical protein